MAQMLLINPRKRRATKRKAGAKRRVRARARRKNPITRTATARKVMRRRNPVGAMRRRVMRRRNPIGGMGGMGSYMNVIRDAVMGGAGAIMIDVVYGQINKFLPATLRTVPGTIGAGDAVKAIGTVFLGHALNKMTRGYSRKAAMASLTVQAYNLMKGFVPTTLPLGYASPAMIAQGTNRVGPIRRGMNAYTSGTPLLSAYTASGSGSPLLNGGRAKTASREGVSQYY
jgi:hypothetical protein